MSVSRSFSADLSKFGETVDKRMTKLIRMAALDLLKNLQATNPVDSGWSRGSWQISVNKRETGVYSFYSGSWVGGSDWHGNKPPRGTHMDVPAQKDHLPALRWTDRVYVFNAVPYVVGSGPNAGDISIEQRTGFIAKAMAEARVVLSQIAKSLAR